MPYRPFGEAPIDLAQEVRASPPSPSQASLPPPAPSAEQLARRVPVRAAPRMPPRVVNRGTFQKVPVTAILQAGGMNGAPIQATNINGAPVMVDPLDRPGSLAAVHMDTSVSAQVRGAKALGALRADGVQVSGDYTDAIRNAAGFAFGPKRMPRQGFAAASYSYPAKQMVVGATLAGTPIVNKVPVPGASPAPAPKLVTRRGIRGQISSSPSEERRRLLSTLQGLAGAPNVSWVSADAKSVADYGKADWGINIRTFIDDLPNLVPAGVREEAKSLASSLSSLPLPWSTIANNIGAKSIIGKELPPYVREAYIKWAYRLTWKADISTENLKRALASSFVSANNLAAVVADPTYDPTFKSRVERTDAEVGLFITRMAEAYRRIHGCPATDKRLGEWRAWAYEATSAKMFADAMASQAGVDFLVKGWPGSSADDTAKRGFCAVAGSGGDAPPPAPRPKAPMPIVQQPPVINITTGENKLRNTIINSGDTQVPRPTLPQPAVDERRPAVPPSMMPPALPAVPAPVAQPSAGLSTPVLVGGLVAAAAVIYGVYRATRK